MLYPKKNFWANLYLKLEVIVLAAACIYIAFLISTSNPYSSNYGLYNVYVNGNYSGQQYLNVTENSFAIVVALGLFGGAVGVSFQLLFRQKNIVDFTTCYVPLGEASRRRKVVFYLALFLGWLGIDRMALRCPMRGIVKLLLGLWNLLYTYLYIDAFDRNPENTLLLVISLLPLVLWWTTDLLLVGMGAAKTKGDYLR